MAENNNVLSQDLSSEAKYSGVYMMNLLFREKCASPSIDIVVEKLKERFGDVDIVGDNTNLSSFALSDHTIAYEGGKKAPSMVIITECESIEKPLGDAVARTQFWDCPNGVELLDSCSWQVMIGDFMARGLPALERAEILADWLEIALELFPSCVAVYFQASAKLLTAEQLKDNPYSGALRFFYGGVNARFFNIQGTNDMLVDTLGMYAFALPDMQYHFHTLNPNEVVNHAYNTAIYQFENDAPIKQDDTIQGLDSESKWKCQYESALIQPKRDVLDINTGEYAAGNRK